MENIVEMGARANISDYEASESHEASETSLGSRFRRGLAEMIRSVGPPFFVALAAVTLVASVVGLLLKNTFENSALVRFDYRLAEDLEANRTATLDDLTGIGTFFADPLPVAVVWFVAVVAAAVVLRHWRPPLFFMVAIGGEKLSYLFTTLVVDRPRPEVETVGKVHVTSSYPSGHVGSAVSLWAGLALLVMTLLVGRLHKRAVIVSLLVGLFFALEVGYSRLYRGHHFLTDVLAGVAIGAAWVVIAYRIVLAPYLEQQRNERRKPTLSAPIQAQRTTLS